MTFRKIPPADFQGFRDDLPVRRYTRALPHWRQEGATYFVTFHTNDSIPTEAKRKLQAIRETFDQKHPPPQTDEQLLEKARRLAAAEERWLDAGHGACPFKQMANRTLLRESLMSESLVGYSMGAWIMMPNHVHVLIRPESDEELPLEKILKRWKGRSSRELNKLSGSSGSVWFEESFDRIVRDTEHLWRCLQYIGNNGKLAGLPDDAFERWVSPAWIESGWDFEG